MYVDITMDDPTQTLRIAHLVLSFLDEEYKKSTTNADSKESLEVAMQCLETAFNITLQDTAYKSSMSIREMFRKCSGESPGAAASSASASAGAFGVKNNNLFHSLGQYPVKPGDYCLQCGSKVIKEIYGLGN